METIELPRSDLQASRIGLGTWAIGGWMWGGTDERESNDTIRSAVERGMTFIDTAPVYGFGRSEEIVGKALEQGDLRDRVVLATKCGIDWEGSRPFRDGSRARIEREIDDSLRRLRTDHIDLYQVHWPDAKRGVTEAAEALRSLREQGKVRAVGVSNFSVDQMRSFAKVCPLSTIQPPYNLFEREIERDVLPAAREDGVGTVAYGALCRGLLSGKMTQDSKFEGDDLRQHDPKFQPPRYGQYLEAVRRLDALAREHHGKRVLHLAVRWLLDRPGVSVALWGARRPSQLDAAFEVMGWSLDEATEREIDRILQDTIVDPVGPEFMAPPL